MKELKQNNLESIDTQNLLSEMEMLNVYGGLVTPNGVNISCSNNTTTCSDNRSCNDNTSCEHNVACNNNVGCNGQCGAGGGAGGDDNDTDPPTPQG